VSNGHTFFVQKLHQITKLPPICVHTTYQYGDATNYAYGKRQRLRDELLWAMDGPEYFQGRFLQLVTEPARLLSPERAELLLPEVIDAAHCVRSHQRLSMLQRQWLHDGFLLAAATKRTLIIPPIWCMLDRFWTILNHCLIGSKVGGNPLTCITCHLIAP
jgi:arabinosyltransferase